MSHFIWSKIGFKFRRRQCNLIILKHFAVITVFLTNTGLHRVVLYVCTVCVILSCLGERVVMNSGFFFWYIYIFFYHFFDYTFRHAFFELQFCYGVKTNHWLPLVKTKGSQCGKTERIYYLLLTVGPDLRVRQRFLGGQICKVSVRCCPGGKSMFTACLRFPSSHPERLK